MKQKTMLTVVALIVMMLMLPVAAISSAANDCDITYDADEMTVGNILSITGASSDGVSDDVLAFEIPMNYESDMMVMIFPILAAIVVGIVVGAVITWAANKFSAPSESTPNATEEEVKAALRELRSDIITSNWQNVAGLFSKLITNDAQMLSFTEAYFNLQAETAAADLWSATGTFIPDRILTRSTYVSNFSTYKYNVLSAINEFSLEMSTQRNIFNDPSKTATYGSMRMGWSWGSTQWLDQSGDAWMALTDYVKPTANNNRVYVDVVDYVERLSNTNYMYVFGGAGEITNATTGASYTLSEGVNDLLAMGIAPGWYDLAPGRTYAGNLLPSASVNGMDPSAAMILYSNGTYAISYQHAGQYTIQRGTESWQAPDVSMLVTYPDALGTVITASIEIDHIMDSYQLVTDTINHAAKSVVQAAQAAWIIYDQLGESSSLIKPSSIISGMQNNTTLTAEQQAAIYAVALQQLAIYGQTVRPEDIKISRESLDLVVHGDIYYRGTLIAQNAVYTPFTYLEDTILAVGNHDWNAPGMAMIWATNVTSLEDWSGQMVQYEMVQLGEGYQVRVNDIVHHGVQVSSLTLTVDSMEHLGLVGYDVPDTTPSWTFSEIPDTTWMWIAIIIMLMGYGLIAAYLAPAGKWAILLVTLVDGGLALLIVTGILGNWIDGLSDSLFGWWPFTLR